MESLTGLIAFAHTAELRSFVGAARRLGISASAVGKSVTRLEQKLGVRLLTRSTRSLRLTSEGVLFHERCKRIVNEIAEAEAVVQHAAQVPKGCLRISVPTIGYRFLMPHIPTFRRLYPEVELDIDFSDRMVDVVAEGFDAVIRSGPLADSSLRARRIGTFGFVLCCSPEYLAKHGVPKVPHDLAHHQCLRYRFLTTGKLQPWALGTQQKRDLPTAITVNNIEALLRAALRGLGICYLPTFVARDALKSGRLQAVLGAFTTTTSYFSVVYPARQRVSPKLRAFLDFVHQRLFD